MLAWAILSSLWGKEALQYYWNLNFLKNPTISLGIEQKDYKSTQKAHYFIIGLISILLSAWAMTWYKSYMPQNTSKIDMTWYAQSNWEVINNK